VSQGREKLHESQRHRNQGAQQHFVAAKICVQVTGMSCVRGQPTLRGGCLCPLPRLLQQPLLLLQAQAAARSAAGKQHGCMACAWNMCDSGQS
jgi:hypothetical protein